jgi:hypothetical protein
VSRVQVVWEFFWGCQTFHPDRDSIGIPVHQLDAIASAVEENEQATVANVALEICFDDPKEPIETLAHVDGFSMKIDWDRGVDCAHRLGDLFEYFSERVGSR